MSISNPKITGITIHPKVVPEDLVSTFFGDLGWARTKGYVIPVDSDGVMGWQKVVATEGAKVGGEFVRPNQVPSSMTIPDFPSRLQAPAATVDRSAPQNIVYTTSISNMSYNDALKIATIQAFSQIGVIFLAILVVITAAVIFVCCSSFLKWPMMISHSWSFRNIGMFRGVIIPSKLRAKNEHEGKQQEATVEVGMIMEDQSTRRRYLGGATEAIMVDDDWSSSCGSTSSASAGSFDGGSGSAMSVSTGPSARGARDRNMPVVALVSSGSQSKAEGSRLRVMSQYC